MSDKQRRPRSTAAAATADSDRRHVRPPMDSGIFALLRRGNQAMNEQVAARQGAGNRAAAPRAPTSGGSAMAAAAMEPASYQDVWEDVQDMILHGHFSFRQLVTIIEQQTEMPTQDRMRMKEQARQLYRQRRGDDAAP